IDIYRQKLWEHYKKRKLFATMKNLKDNPKFPDDLPFDDNTNKKIKKGELNYEDVWKDGGSYNENGDMYNNGNKAIWVWGKYKNADINNELVYYPEEFDKYDHKGKTKLELIKETEGTAFPGYIVTLHENMPNIPRKREGKTIGGREQLEAGEVITDYLKIMQTNNQYVNEIGQTPDEQIIYALQCLEQTNQVIDDYQGKGSVSYQL
ncbi:hypothetical protein KKB40_00825, partial [Patescibacteria group bacterium]|nr:hypothetical protein [Patescibacteria group bacterium]